MKNIHHLGIKVALISTFLFLTMLAQASIKEVEELINQQRFQDASNKLLPLIEEARKRNDDLVYAKLITKQTLLKIGLHGYETAVEELRERAWPQSPLPHAMVSIVYARSLKLYQDSYSWEIRKREKMSARDKFDLKILTSEEIYQEAFLAYDKAWKKRVNLGKLSREAMTDLITANTYPKEVRGTLRDTLTYLLVELLNDTSGWKPRESNDVYLLSIDCLLDIKKKVAITDEVAHPLEKISTVLGDLESFHKTRGHPEGALEARLELYRILNQHFTSKESKEKLIGSLKREIESKKSVSWVSMGYAELAELHRSNDDAKALVTALSIATKGNELHPKSPGAARCRDIVSSIKQPSLNVEGMNIDGNGKRTLSINYKNLSKLYFRSVRVDYREFISKTKDYSLRPGWRELDTYLQAKPEYTWTKDLNETEDYRNHTAFVSPPLHKNGFYVVLVSNESTFRSGVVQGVQSFFSDYSFNVIRNYEKEEFIVEVMRGETGEAVKDAKVTLYQADYQSGHKIKGEAGTDKNGIAVLSLKSFMKNYGNYFFVVEKNGHVIGSRNPTYMYGHNSGTQELRNAFVYTDRSIYRPEQKILWKIVGYTGQSDSQKFTIAKDINVDVYLRDANGENVSKVVAKTNKFGSASGEFLIPKGKLLGNWTIQTSMGGGASLKVEEYKRPTFLIEMSKDGAEYRLNKEAVLSGKAKYFFGMPVTAGKAAYTIHRRVILPWWCFWGGWDWGSSRQDALLDSGVAKLKGDGSFEIKFTPKADENFSSDMTDVKYNYAVKIDVTDEGGETQSTDFNTMIGFVAVNGILAFDREFYLENSGPKVDVTRSDLNGRPLPGKAEWTLFLLEQPKTTVNPSEIPFPSEMKEMKGNNYKHPDDFLLKRWTTNYSAELYLREWKNANKVSGESLSHGSDGKAKVVLPKLKEGVYRLVFTTNDSFGKTFQTQKEFFVVNGKSQFNIPAFMAIEESSVEVGGKARILVMSGYKNQRLIFEIFRSGKLFKRQELLSGKDSTVIEIPVLEEDRGGMGLNMRLVRDYQELNFSKSLMVPYSNKEVDVAFSTMRDKMRPGSKESWAITIKGKDGRNIDPLSFELLAYMYDKSLDSFTPHQVPYPLNIYPFSTGTNFPESELGAGVMMYTNRSGFPYSTEYSGFQGDYVNFYPNYGIGGPGSRGRGGMLMMKKGGAALLENSMMADSAMEAAAPASSESQRSAVAKSSPVTTPTDKSEQKKDLQVRSNFSENGFWKPHLVPGKDGKVTFEFTVPDSVTGWQVWAHAISKDLQSGSVNRESQSVKELMVRPYLPRFFREGDEATIKIVVNNSSDREMNGNLKFEILDEQGKKSLAKDFSLESDKKPFKVSANSSTTVGFKIKAPVGISNTSIKVTAETQNISDAEVRPLPVLPGRMHLAQSKFVTLKNKDKKDLTFADLVKSNDDSLVHDSLVVTLDAQLFYSVLSAVPYLVNYPYQNTEMMMNVFVSSGILSSVFEEFPEVGKMAKEFSNRKTRLESWSEPDPNRKLTLEEAPWLNLAKGGDEEGQELMSVLHPDIARNTRTKFLRMLKESQTSSGGFPWFPGGPPSPFVTLDLLYGFSKALEFKVDVPKDVTAKAWQYLHEHYIAEVVQDLMGHDVGWEFITLLNYVLSNYPDASYGGGVFTESERKTMLDFTMKHWKSHSPYMKSYLAMNLKRAKRDQDAKLVWDSVMDSAKNSDDEGTHWAQEDRSWLWYNDTIQTHAMALRTGQELGAKREQLDGLVQWLFLNKKLNHWKSTRATSEVVYALTHFLKKTKQLGIKEKISVSMGNKDHTFLFDPDKYTGKKNQIVVQGDDVSSKLVPVTVKKDTQGLAFASATWHYSTEKLPKMAVGDFLSVNRKYFKRVAEKSGFKLYPFKEGEKVSLGDEVEVHLSLKAKHQMEYVHLRDPRAAGFGPVDGTSKHKWELGIYWYEEIRDSGTNFFFERLPQGEYNFRYRLRASTEGNFRVGPAFVQPLYAPELVGFSEGHELKVE